MKKIVGIDYLHRHPKAEAAMNIESGHVIVDKRDWEQVVRYFQRHPEAVEELENIIVGVDVSTGKDSSVVATLIDGEWVPIKGVHRY